MKNVIIAVACMAAIIIARMILSLTFSEQVADVFCRVSIDTLFFYCIIATLTDKAKARKSIHS